jgi:hypothetical protein
MSMLPPSPSCAKSFTYKIEPLGDTPGNRVSWLCLAPIGALNQVGKTDVLGFHLGMTKDELTFKLDADKLKCESGRADDRDVFHCRINGDEELTWILI